MREEKEWSNIRSCDWFRSTTEHEYFHSSGNCFLNLTITVHAAMALLGNLNGCGTGKYKFLFLVDTVLSFLFLVNNLVDQVAVFYV